MAKTIVLGSVNVDLVIRSRRLPAPGETVVGGEFFRAEGGKGANQAVAAARAARERVAFIAAVGDDAFGATSRENLARAPGNPAYLATAAFIQLDRKSVV